MTRYINTVALQGISINEIIPVRITLEDLPSTGSHALTEATRLDLSIDGDPGVDIVTECGIAVREVTVGNIWLQSETPADGSYRIRLIATADTGTVQVECNLMIVVLGS